MIAPSSHGDAALAHSLLDNAAQVDAAECAIERANIDAAEAGDCERVGKWQMRIAHGEATRDAEQRWNDRADALTAWLMSEWERGQAKEAGESR